MKFQVLSGQNIISIGLSEIGSYFSFNKPQSVVWYDCKGSVAKYLCLLPHDKNYRLEVRKNLLDRINQDFTNKDKELYDLISPLGRLFANGEYELNFYHSKGSKYFEYKTSADNYSVTHQQNWFIIFSESIDPKDAERKKKEHENYMRERTGMGYMCSDIVEFSTENFYEGRDVSFIATQPKSEINLERVKYFENIISQGKRPFAIIFNCHLRQLKINLDKSVTDYSLDSENYVLDGHHKLIAYKNLNINPSIVEITHLPKNRNELDFNIEKLIEGMYPYQIEHILKNWSERDEYIERFLKNPLSKIHSFIKNGQHQELYNNGKLKHSAFYINDRIEGEGKWWYENGQLKEIRFYKHSRPFGRWITYFESGQIEMLQQFNDDGRQDGRQITYHENGRIGCEEFLKNGVNADGYSYLTWFEDGSKEAELKYLNGRMIERKNYNQDGQLINFEEYGFQLGIFVQRV